MLREDQLNTRQLCSKNRTESELRNSTASKADIRLRTHRRPSPLPPSSLTLTSFPTHGGPRHSQNSWVKYKHTEHTLTLTHTHTRSLPPQAWEHCLDSARLVPGTKEQGTPLPLL